MLERWFISIFFTDTPIQVPFSFTSTHERLACIFSTQPIGDPKVIKLKLADEGVTIFDILFGVDVFDTDEPERPDEIGDQEDNDDQTSNSEREHDKLLCLSSVCTLRIFVVVFDQTFYSGNIE